MVPLIASPDQPRVPAQLWPDTLGGPTPSTGPADCSVCCTIGQIVYHTDGAVMPSRAEARQIAGQTNNHVGLSSAMIRRILNHFSIPFTDLPDFAAFEAALADPRNMISVAESNAWWNNNQPQVSGDRGYQGPHRVCYRGREQIWASGKTWLERLDPVADGRVRNGTQLAKQPTMVKIAWAESAMLALGSFSAISVGKA